MYVAAHFRPSRPEAAWELVGEHGFGTLVSAGGTSGPVGSPLPFLAQPGEGKLLGHIARANPLLALLAGAQPATVLVIFQGPSGFISGSYYDDQHAIPTWDHMTVHISGVPRVLEADRTLGVLEQTVAHYEQRAGSSWRLDPLRADLPAMAAQVAAFEVAVTRVDASSKLSQNIEPRQCERLVSALRVRGERELADAITAHNPARAAEPAST